MKLSSKILLSMLALLIAGLLYSNIVLKKEYDKVDKSDPYWTFKKILEQPFSHLKVTGGNTTSIAYEQNTHASVRVYKNWQGYHNKLIGAVVKNDTLFLTFPPESDNIQEKYWMKSKTLVRLCSPNLLSVEGFDTNLEMFRMKQKNISVQLSGKSSFELESMTSHFDTLKISQKDSSMIVFEMAPEYNYGSNNGEHTANGITSRETLYVNFLQAAIQGRSLLDIGHAQINEIRLNIADSSGIILSGEALRKLPK